MRCALPLVLVSLSMAVSAFAQAAEADFTALRDAYVARFRPAYIELEEANWAANISGTDADYARVRAASKALIDLHSDHDVFAKLKALRAGGEVRDPVLARELEVMYLAFLPGQADPALAKRIADLEADLDQLFNTHRSQVGDKQLSENVVRAILATSTDSAAVEAAWKGYMEIGRKAEAKLHELVGLRNELARQLGYDNFFSLQLAIQEIDEKELFKLFEELDALTRGPFTQLKHDLDAVRAARFGVKPAELRPWHFGDLFFQEVPRDDEMNLDTLFADADLVALAKTYYASIGLPVDDILACSDLYEKPGKCPHAFCADINRSGDVRILCNMTRNVYWADTILHELGHAVYDKYIGADVPFVVHMASHALTTEGIAQMFGALAKNEEYLRQVIGVDAAKAAEVGAAARAALRAERLIFSRWSQVMLHFEYGMYANPDQDLGKLWWDLKQRYQMLNPPESTQRPDYAAKTHILSTPAYYHNYLMGELFAAQVRHKITADVLHRDDVGRSCFYRAPQVGDYLREQVFAPGSLYAWNELTRRATGEPLTAKYYAAEVTE
ncbi:MAG: M2 family metallopeptidase [Phycisphaerae bacterium]|jgi:peptidyl-dipeptidase A